MKVINPTLTINPETLPDAIVGLPYEQELTVSGGDPASDRINFTVTGLPDGFSWNPDTRKISSPNSPVAGSFSVLAKVYNTVGEVGFRNY